MSRIARAEGRWTRSAPAAILAAGLALVPSWAACAQEPLLTILHYLERQVERPPLLSNFDPLPAGEGARGAELGLQDNAAGGRFQKLSFQLKSVLVPAEAAFLPAAREFLERERPGLIVVNAPADDLLALADLPEAAGVLLLNAGASDVRLRDRDCRANLLHTLASTDMLTDALAQFLVAKRWSRAMLVAGVGDRDRLYAEAFRRSAKKFGARIVAEKSFDASGADLRRSAGTELAVLTQGPEHDVVVVADEIGDFGPYLPYHTASPRPVTGTQGLTPVAWARPVEAYGATQLQNRFMRLAGRPMTAIDYAAWLAARAVGEAVTRIRTTDPAAIRKELLGESFEVAGFKGRALSFRPWNGQLRQPIPLVWPGSLVAVAPIEGFLHQRTELDTLGLDAPETACTAMAR